MTPATLPTPQVYLEDPDPARRALVNQTLAHLAAPDTPAGQGTQATLSAFIGQANSHTVAEAVQTIVAKTGADPSVIRADIALFIKQLRRTRLIQGRTP